MTVKELIAQLQKLPEDDEIVADVFGDDLDAEVVCVRKRAYLLDVCCIAVDRSRWLKEQTKDIKSIRDDTLEVYQTAKRKEEPEDEDVW